MRALLVSSNSDDKTFFTAVAQAVSMPLHDVASADKACDELLKDPSALVIVDISTAEQYQAFEKAVSDKIGMFSATLVPNNILYVASMPLHECSFLRQTEIFGHFVQRSFSEIDRTLISRIFAMATKERAFGVENYFAADARGQTISITKTIQKKVIIESLKNHLIKIGFKARMATVVANATDELIMNAIFDAPIDELGRRIHEKTSRNAVFDLEGKNVVELKIVFDGKVLGISVVDNHGSLDRKKLVAQHLGRSYSTTEYQTKTSIANAGLGLSQVFRSCGGLVFACDTGNRTEVTLFYRKTVSFKEFKDQFRFLSTFVYFS